jgi:hypothetical protein
MGAETRIGPKSGAVITRRASEQPEVLYRPVRVVTDMDSPKTTSPFPDKAGH